MPVEGWEPITVTTDPERSKYRLAGDLAAVVLTVDGPAITGMLHPPMTDELLPDGSSR